MVRKSICVVDEVSESDVQRPFFDRVFIQLPQGSTPLIIEATGAAAGKIYVKSLIHNGTPIVSPILTHEQIMKGGILHFDMQFTPQTWGSNQHLTARHEEL